MKKFLILLIFFLACSGDEAYIEPTTTVQDTTTTTVQDTTTTSTSTTVLKDFIKDWEYQLKDRIFLSDTEAEVTENFYELWFSKYPPNEIQKENFYEIKVHGRSCYRIYSSSGTAFLDEIHPMAEVNNYLVGTTRYGKELSYTASTTYECDESGVEDIDDYYFSGIYLFGPPFYYEESWWIYKSVSLAEIKYVSLIFIDMSGPSNRPAWDFATRVKIETNDEFDSVPKSRERRGIFPYDEDYSKKGTLAKVTLPIANGIITTVDISPKDTIRTYEIIYPQVKNHPSQACYDSINTEIENYVTTYVESDLGTEIYRKEIKEEEYDPGGYSYYSWMNLRYEIIEASDEVYSLFLYWDSYGAGAAHPISDPYSFNYDIKNCKKITILDLFDTNKNYVEGGYVGEKYIDIIHREVVLQLCAPETVESCESYAYSFDNFYDEPNIFLAGTTEFAIGQYGLFIQFWEYDFGYSSGEELILLPWHDILITLNKNGPYSDILKIYSQKNELATKYEPEWEFDN